MKCSTTVIMILVLFAYTSIAAQTITTLFFKGETQTSDYSKKTYSYFEYDGSFFFIASSEVGPSESMSIDPVIISNASVDMYVFIRVEMLGYNGSELYELNPDSGWRMEEAQVVGDKFIAVYRYDEVLTPSSSTSSQGSSPIMVDMSVADYAVLSDVNVTMTDYACGIEDDMTT